MLEKASRWTPSQFRTHRALLTQWAQDNLSRTYIVSKQSVNSRKCFADEANQRVCHPKFLFFFATGSSVSHGPVASVMPPDIDPDVWNKTKEK